MSSFIPPEYNSDIFNSGLFEISNETITIAQADKRYLKLSGGVLTGALTINSSLTVLDRCSAKFIESESTDATAITSSSNCDTYGIHLHAILSGATGFKPATSIAFNNSTSDNVPLANILLDKIGTSEGELSIGCRNGSTCAEVLRVSSTGINVLGVIKNNGTSLDLTYITGITPGTATATKAMVLDSSKGITGVSNITFSSPSSNSIYISGNGVYEAFSINNGTSNFGIFNNGSAGYVRMTSNHPLYFGTNGAVRFQIAANGRIGNTSTTLQYDIDMRGCLRSEGILSSVSTATAAPPSGNIWSYNAGMVAGDRQTHFQWGRTTTDSDFAHYRLESYYNAAADKLNNHMIIKLVSAAGGISMNGWGDVRITARNGGAAQQTTIAALEVVGSENAYVGAGYGYFNSGQASIPGGTVPLSIATSTNIWCAGTVYVTSDKRLKKNIRYLEDSECNKILELRGMEFYWLDDEVCDYKNYGFIAQEVREILPELVGYVPNKKVDDGLQLVLSLEKFIPYIIGVLKNQQKRITDLESIISTFAKP